MTRPKQCPFPSNILPIKTEQVIHKKDGSETEENVSISTININAKKMCCHYKT